MPSYSEPKAIRTRSLTSGWEAVITHGDGTATKVWAMTEARALEKAQEAVIDE